MLNYQRVTYLGRMRVLNTRGGWDHWILDICPASGFLQLGGTLRPLQQKDTIIFGRQKST
jgi:hypothetical protein